VLCLHHLLVNHLIVLLYLLICHRVASLERLFVTVADLLIVYCDLLVEFALVVDLVVGLELGLVPCRMEVGRHSSVVTQLLKVKL